MIEVIVGLAVLALLTVLIASAIQTGRHVLQSQKTEAEQISVLQVRALLTKVIEEAQPISLELRKDQPAPFLIGNQKTLTFISSYAPRGAYGGLYTTTLSIEPIAGEIGKFALFLTRKIYRPHETEARADEKKENKPLRLLSDLTSGSISYLRSKTIEKNPIWRTEWTLSDRLPIAIKIELAMRRHRASGWPPLLIALPLATQ